MHEGQATRCRDEVADCSYPGHCEQSHAYACAAPLDQIGPMGMQSGILCMFIIVDLCMAAMMADWLLVLGQLGCRSCAYATDGLEVV
jgi:hypothetical protein